MLLEVVVIVKQHSSLNPPGLRQRRCLHPAIYRLWHATDDHVVLQQHLVFSGQRLDRLPIPGLNRIDHGFLAICPHELGERQWIDIQPVYLADGKGLSALLSLGLPVFVLVRAKRQAKKRPRCHDRKLRHVFLKELQRRKCAWALLYLVKYQQRFTWDNQLSRCRLQQTDKRRGVNVPILKLFAKRPLAHEIHENMVFGKLTSRKFLHKPCLADLTCAHQDERLSIPLVFPLHNLF